MTILTPDFSRLPEPEVQAQICLKYSEGALVSELRDEHDLNWVELDKVLKDGNVVRRVFGEAKRTTPPELEDAIARDYMAGGRMRTLAKKYEVDRSTVKRIIMQRGIPFHSVKEVNVKKLVDREGVCLDYVAGMSVEQISEKHGLSTATTARILHAKGIQMRHKGAPGRKSPLTEEQLAKAVDFYNSGLSISETKAIIGSKTSTVSFGKMLVKRGVKLRTISEQNTLYPYNERFFDTPVSTRAAYVLGWLYTDGCLRDDAKKVFCLELHEMDRCIVEYVRDEICPSRPLYECKEKHSVIAHFCSKGLHAAARRLGLHPAKSHTLEYPDWITDETFPHFLRGVIEGDGSVLHITGNRFTVGFCGNSQMVRTLAETLQNRYGIRLNECVTHLGNYRYITTSWDGALKLATLMYRDAHMACPRKFKAFQSALKGSETVQAVTPEIRAEAIKVSEALIAKIQHLL